MKATFPGMTPSTHLEQKPCLKIRRTDCEGAETRESWPFTAREDACPEGMGIFCMCFFCGGVFSLFFSAQLLLIGGFRCWYGCTFSDFSERHFFWKSKNVSDQSCPQYEHPADLQPTGDPLFWTPNQPCVSLKDFCLFVDPDSERFYFSGLFWAALSSLLFSVCCQKLFLFLKNLLGNSCFAKNLKQGLERTAQIWGLLSNARRGDSGDVPDGYLLGGQGAVPLYWGLHQTVDRRPDDDLERKDGPELQSLERVWDKAGKEAEIKLAWSKQQQQQKQQQEQQHVVIALVFSCCSSWITSQLCQLVFSPVTSSLFQLVHTATCDRHKNSQMEVRPTVLIVCSMRKLNLQIL